MDNKVYLFQDGSWMWQCEYNSSFHFEKGSPHEVVIGANWSSREVGEMLLAYYVENSDQIFV